MKEIKKKKTKIKKKKKFYTLATIVLLISMVFTFCFCYLLTPKIEIENKNLVFNYDEQVKIPKYHAYAMNKEIDKKVKVKSDVKEHEVGNYFVHYQVKYSFFSVEKLALIKIVDKKKPEIILKGAKDVYVCPSEKYEEIGFSAKDEYDGDLTDKVLIKNDKDKIYYKVEDSSHNTFVTSRNVYYEDKEKPVITLKGSNKVYLYLNNTYQETGFDVKDNCDKNIEVKVSGTVNTKKIGTYKITYTATDTSNNTTSVERYVEVISKPESGKGIIYLTFDDGPSNSITPKVLEILKNKGILATFFVINHDDSLNYLIKREYTEGHSVALHSYTHNYQYIYSSVDNYFSDLNKIRDKVYKITGEYTNIIRFPGGGSNTISKKYQPGIMSQLTSDVSNKGFHYFDWNVDCQDGAGVRDPNRIYQNVIGSLSKSRENVVLMHDFENNYGTLNALENIIDYGIQNGYQFRKITMDTKEIHHRPNN